MTSSPASDRTSGLDSPVGNDTGGGSVDADQRVLRATALWKAYRRGWWPRRRTLPVLKGADLEMQPGEAVGLVGENGSGKSTLMKVLVGDLVADSGTVERTASFGYCPQVAVLY